MITGHHLYRNPLAQDVNDEKNGYNGATKDLNRHRGEDYFYLVWNSANVCEIFDDVDDGNDVKRKLRQIAISVATAIESCFAFL